MSKTTFGSDYFVRNRIKFGPDNVTQTSTHTQRTPISPSNQIMHLVQKSITVTMRTTKQTRILFEPLSTFIRTIQIIQS